MPNANQSELARERVPCTRYSPSLESVMREVRHRLGNIDFQHDADMEKLATSLSDEEVVKPIREGLQAKHRTRRETYLQLLVDLQRQQSRQASAG